MFRDLLNWLGRGKGQRERRTPRSAASGRHVRRLQIDSLEERTLLAATFDWAFGLDGWGSWAKGTAHVAGEAWNQLSSVNASIDVFVAKLSPAGGTIWTARTSGTRPSSGAGIAVDSSSNVLVTGYFYAAVDFDPGQYVLGKKGQTSSSAFVWKLNSGGNFVWAKNFQPEVFSGSSGYGIATDLAGNVSNTGNFDGTVDFDPGKGKYNLQSGSGSDVYVSKLNSAGNPGWVKTFGGSDNVSSSAIAPDSAGVFTLPDGSRVQPTSIPAPALPNSPAPGIETSSLPSSTPPATSSGTAGWAERVAKQQVASPWTTRAMSTW